jgi:hypothetical protein
MHAQHRQAGQKPSSRRRIRPSERYLQRGRVGPHPDRVGTDHARQRGWTVAATFNDDRHSGFKEITRDGFGELIAAIEAGQVDG